MKKEIEQRAVDTKVIKDNFKKNIETKMNKLLAKGYVPIGGLSSHMNTQMRPLVNMDIQEYLQTMVKYENFEVWVKDSNEDIKAFSDENSRQRLMKELVELSKSIPKDLDTIDKLTVLLDQPARKDKEAKKTFFSNLKTALNDSVESGRRKRLRDLQALVIQKKSSVEKLKSDLSMLELSLSKYYESNPLVTKEILLNSK